MAGLTTPWDVFARFAMDWQALWPLQTDLALDAVEADGRRRPARCDLRLFWSASTSPHRGMATTSEFHQDTAACRTMLLAEEGAVTLGDTRADSHDHGLSESFNDCYNQELIRRDSSCRGLEDGEFVTLK